MTPLLTVLDLEKFYGARRVLDGLSFTVHRGDRIGIVGLNGSGKSTLMRIVVTEASSSDPDDKPDHGEIRRARGLSLVYVPQEPKLDPDHTVEEVLRAGQARHAATHARLAALEDALHTLGGDALDDALHEQATLHERLARMGGWDVSHELRAIHTDFGLAPLDARIGDLSGGERRRTAIAQALLGHPDLLALDEPTNHLDLAATAWLEGWLANRVDALLLVTHDRRFLDRVATRILELDRGKIHAYEGNYTSFLEKQAERLANEAVREEKRAAFVRRELDWIRRGPAARTTKQQARIDRFDEAVASRPDHRERPPDAGGPTLRLPPGPRLGKTVVETRKLCRKQGDRWLVKDLDFKLAAGERVGIVGPNGAGKTTLLRLLMGKLPPDKGEVQIGVNTRFAFLDQGRTELDDTKTVLEEVADGNDWVVLPDQNVHVRTFLRWLLFDDRAADTRIGRLSGGERNRVLLARLLRKGGNVLVLDEPTNDLDLQTLSVLEEALADFPGCVLVVSHDRWFLDKVATSILAFEGDGRVVRHEGNFSYWLEKGGDATRGTWTNRPAAPRPGDGVGANPDVASAPGSGGGGGAAPPATPPPGPPTSRRKLSFKEKKELEGMESAILAAEARVAALDAELADPATYRNLGGDGIRARATELDGLRAEVERLYARWAELEALA